MIVKYLKWVFMGRPTIRYNGYRCRYCGNWFDKERNIPIYKSKGWWGDTIGICDSCKK